MIALHRHTSRLFPAILAAVLAFALLALVKAPTAGAAKSCAEQIVDDWFGDGRIDRLYPIECYQQAIASLPVDVIEYTDAKDDILRALSFRKKNKPDPGPAGTTPDPTTPPDPTTTDDDPEPVPSTDDTQTETIAGPGDEVDTSGPSSIPVPLLVLGGLSLLLLAAGGAGYVSRRARTDDTDA